MKDFLSKNDLSKCVNTPEYPRNNTFSSFSTETKIVYTKKRKSIPKMRDKQTTQEN